MRTYELPAQMSPCVRIFIASLLDQSATATGETPEAPLAPVIAAQNNPSCDEGKEYAHKFMDAGLCSP